MEKIRNSKIIKGVLLAVGAGIFFVAGASFGYSHVPWIDQVRGIDHMTPEVATTADFEPFWKAWKIIDEKSPDAGKLSAQDRVWGAISGLVGSLNDPYSVFFPPSETKDFQDTINGSFSGVGMEVGMKNQVLTVIAPLKGSPAEKAGVKAGDMILKIDGTTTSNLSIDAAIAVIRGPEGTPIKLTLYREGKNGTFDISVTRAVIDVPTIDSKILPDGTHMISLYSFTANSADLFKAEIQKFKASGSNKLILDLRGNPGGFLDAAIDMASWFLPSGKAIVTEDYGIPGKEQVYRSKGYNIFDKSLKMVILVDGGSASASEILSGALQQQGVAKLVGEQTYGKGSVQELVPLTDDTSIKITIARWLTPDGTSISKKGLTPDYVVAGQADENSKDDPQLDKALELLK